MTKLLLVSGSPVVGSSTELLVKQIGDRVAAIVPEVQTNFVRLNELEFRPCQACGEAPEKGKFCLFDDDLTDLYDAVATCDGIVFGTPIYFDTVSAQAKMFIDRCNCFRPPDYDNVDPEHDFLKILTRKRPGTIVLVGGQRGWFEGARRVVAGFFKWIEVVNLGHLYFGGRSYRSGEAADDEAILAEADQLGELMAEHILRRGQPDE